MSTHIEIATQQQIEALRLRESIIKLVNHAFAPYLSKIQMDRQIIEEYYSSGSSASQFALRKCITVYELVGLCRKYDLPASNRALKAMFPENE